MDINEKHSYKFIFILMLFFSIPSFIIFYNYYDIGLRQNIYLNILCVFNYLCIILLVITNIIFFDKKSKYSIAIIIALSLYFLITLIMSIDYLFFGFVFFIIYYFINIINFILYIIIGTLPILILNLPNRIGYAIVGFLFTLLYNILFTVLFKIIKYKKNNIRDKIIILYYIQCNSCLIYLFCANAYIQSV
jgi:hypothetical protein